MAKVAALWYGGSNYAAPDPGRDLEQFTSIADAKRAFASRADFDPFYPCVDEDACEMHLYLGGEYHDNGPDRVLTIGGRR